MIARSFAFFLVRVKWPFPWDVKESGIQGSLGFSYMKRFLKFSVDKSRCSFIQGSGSHEVLPMDEQKWWLGLDANKSIFNSTPNESRFETNVMSKLHRQVSKHTFFTITKRFFACDFLSPIRRLKASNFNICKPLIGNIKRPCAPKSHISQSSEAGI